jgi:hypothetical protein
MADELTREIDDIAHAAADLSLTIVPGSIHELKFPVVEWDTSSPSTWKTYLAMAKTLGSSYVVLEKYDFDQTALEQLGPERPEGEEREEFEDEEQADGANEFEATWEKITQEYSEHYGSLSAFALYYFSNGICHRYDREADWYTKLTNAASALKEEMEAAQAESEEEEIPELTEEEIEEMASELAKYEVFQNATNQNARRFALKKKFPKLAEEHHQQIFEIIDQAKGIFELEIKPELEKALENQIADLAKQGLSKDQIAKKLKLPVSRVKKSM